MKSLLAMSYFQAGGSHEHYGDQINVDFLLPTGILVPLACRGTQKLEVIKEMLWHKAKEFPLFGLLRYILSIFSLLSTDTMKTSL